MAKGVTMSPGKKVQKWLKRLEFINGEFPFGEIKEYRTPLGMLHKDDGPAKISPTRVTWYQDGKKHGIDADVFGSITFWYEGICIPRNYHYYPEKLTIEGVLSHKNTEVKYVGIRIIGLEKLYSSKYCSIIHEDTDREGRDRKLFKISNVIEDPLCFIQVHNWSQEDNGDYKAYFLQVPPTMKTCQAAVAWTFRCEPDDYRPVQET